MITRLQRPWKTIAFCVAILMTSQFGSLVIAQVANYSAVDLGTTDGNDAFPTCINNRGDVVGNFVSKSDEKVTRAFFVKSRPDGKISHVLLGPANVYNSIAYSINDSGQIVGQCSPDADKPTHAMLFNIDDDYNIFPTDLTPTEKVDSGAFGINNNGDIVGFVRASEMGSPVVATLFKKSTDGAFQAVNLSLSEWTYSVANSINSSGQIVGTAKAGKNGLNQSFLFTYSPDRGITRKNLGMPGNNHNTPTAINDSGEIIAVYKPAHSNLDERGIVLNVSGPAITRTVMSGPGQILRVNSINKLGQLAVTCDAVPYIYTSNGNKNELQKIVLSNPGESEISLGSSKYYSGRFINDWGQIAAFSRVGGARHALLLNPTKPNVKLIEGAVNAKLVGIHMRYPHVPQLTNPLPSVFNTTFSFLDGTAGVGTSGPYATDAHAQTYGSNRDVQVSFRAEPVSDSFLASDIVEIKGTVNDLLVIQLSYDSTTANELFINEIHARLGCFENGHWTLASGERFRDKLVFAGDRVYNKDTDLHLGTYGIDVKNHVVWAVVDHEGLFGVIIDPEVRKRIEANNL